MKTVIELPDHVLNVSLEEEYSVKELELRTNLFKHSHPSIFTCLQLAPGLPDFVIDEIIAGLKFINSTESSEKHSSLIDPHIKKEVLILVQVFDDFTFCSTSLELGNTFEIVPMLEENIDS